MTESAGNKKEDCHAANGVKPGRNGMVKNHHHHHQYQKQEKVRPHHASSFESCMSNISYLQVHFVADNEDAWQHNSSSQYCVVFS